MLPYSILQQVQFDLSMLFYIALISHPFGQVPFLIMHVYMDRCLSPVHPLVHKLIRNLENGLNINSSRFPFLSHGINY